MYSLYKNEYKTLTPVETTIRRTKVERRETEEMEPIQVIIHMYMTVSQENSLCSYLKQTKMSFLFCFNKIGELESRTEA
jgi:hypothetical protein